MFLYYKNPDSAFAEPGFLLCMERESNHQMQQPGGLLLAARKDGGDTSIFFPQCGKKMQTSLTTQVDTASSRPENRGSFLCL